jgi:hypothetical protein
MEHEGNNRKRKEEGDRKKLLIWNIHTAERSFKKILILIN